MIKKIKEIPSIQVESSKLPRIKLQLFSEQTDTTESTTDVTQTTEEVTTTQTEEKTFSQDDVNKIVAQRLERERKKLEESFDTKLQAKLEEEKEEAKKLAKMNADEKERHELDKAKKDLEDREKVIQFKNLKFTAIDILNEKGLPITLVDTLISNDLDAEKTKENIDTFEKAFRAEVEKVVNQRLKGDKPKGPSSTTTTDISSTGEFVDIIKENQIYNQK